jgi:hypothetical protein
MIASENPSGSRELHIEQIWTQLRARRRGQSLFDRITAGSDYGPQDESASGGGRRPVATTHKATDDDRQLAREVLAGKYPSRLNAARKFFEPAVQDRVFAIAERARAKRARGERITAREQELLKYERNAQAVRSKWTGEGAKLVGALDGVEFYT